MKLMEFIKLEHIHIGYEAQSKDSFFKKAVADLGRENDQFDPAAMLSLFSQREKTMTTGIGNGIAVPHITYEACTKMQVHIFRLNSPIDFKSLDDKPVEMIFVLIASTKQPPMLHLQTLAKLGRLIKNEAFINGLRNARDEKKIYEVFKSYE